MEKVKYTRSEYREEYLRSDEWKNLRNIIMSTSPNCQCCGGNACDVHHMVYRNIVDITIKDLIPVCRSCHDYIHKAIDDKYIPQRPQDFEEIKIKTLNILNDEEYKKLRNWLSGKHSLLDSEIQDIKDLKLMRKINGMLKKNLWYENLPELKLTGRRIVEIREFIKVLLRRRGDKLPIFAQRNPGRGGLSGKDRFSREQFKRDKNSKFKKMKGFKSRLEDGDKNLPPHKRGD